MKFFTGSSELMQYLQIVAKVISSKSVTVTPVLNNILFELEGNRLHLTAADMNNRITTSFEVQQAEGNGSFMVPHSIILEAIKELADQPISLEINQEDRQAVLTYSNGHYSFVISESDTYPLALALSGETRSLEISATALRDGLEHTMDAASTEERRPVMTGVCMDFFTDKLVFVASDGRILFKYSDHNVSAPESSSLCVPQKVCQLLARTLLTKEAGDVRLTYDKQYLSLEMERFTLTSRLLEGPYPDYNKVIPSSSPYHITVDRLSLLSAAKRVSIFSNKASKLVMLDVAQGEIHIKANDIDLSVAAEEVIPCQIDQQEAHIRIGFDFDLLQKVLQNIASEQVVLALADQTRAGIVTPCEVVEGIESCRLIVPLKLIGE